MVLISGHILLIVGVYVTAWGLSQPPESSRKKAALPFLRPTFWGLFSIAASGCRYYGALFLGKDSASVGWVIGMIVLIIGVSLLVLREVRVKAEK